MPFTTIAWAESQDAAAAWVKVAGVPDTSVSVSGNDIFAPSLTEVIMYGGVCEQTIASQMRFTSPSMLEFGFEEYVSSIGSALTFGNPPQITQMVGGPIRTVRCTAAAGLSAGQWASSALTFPVSLRAGQYQCVGARVNSTNGVVFRLLFQGSPWRPGGIVVNDEAEIGNDIQRQGQMGLWGEFDSRTTPQIEVLGVTDSAQVVYLDLVYLG